MTLVYSAEFTDFLEELGADETSELEFKEATGGLPRSIWQTISAFANTSGGIIVLGIRERDDGLELVGVRDRQRLLDDQHNQSRNRQKISQGMLQPGSATVREVDGRAIVVIRIRPAERRWRPVFINGQVYGGTYLRRHTGDHVASNEEVNRMMREASDLSADLVILPWVILEDLDRQAFAAYRRRLLLWEEDSPLADFSDIEFLQALDGYRQDELSGEEGVTVAGLLMFGNEAAIRGWRVRHLIDARLLPPGAGRDEPDWADRIVWEGHLFGAYNRIYPWLTRDLPVPFRLVDGVRDHESDQHRALREALVNLLVHADYAERDASLILRWDGGVLFRNPGRSRIPSPGLRSGNRSDPRNPALLRMFRRIGLAEEAGTGFPRIFRTWRELGYEPPSIDPGDERDEFALTLSHQHLLSAADRQWLEALGAPLTQAEQLALVIARYEEWVDNQAVREVTGLHGADASRVLTGLRNRGYLEMEGSKRGASYRLATSIGERSIEGSGPSSGGNEISSGGNEISSGGNEVSSGGNEVSSTRNRVSADVAASGASADEAPDESALSEHLFAIAASARSRRRIPPDRLAQIIFDLCSVQPLSLRELMVLLARREKQVRVTIDALQAAGRIQTLYPQRQHPKQKYLAALGARATELTIDQETS